MTCGLLPYADTRGVCPACGSTALHVTEGWCSVDCLQYFRRNHYWSLARPAALHRDNSHCVNCGFSEDAGWVLADDQYVLYTRSMLLNGRDDNWLEVNHITPRRGQGYGAGCHNHLSNLETLCHNCHVKVTNRQRVEQTRAS